MKLRLVDDATVRALLPMGACMDLMEDALKALHGGHAVNPLRTVMWLPDRSGALGTMPGFLDSPRRLAVKIITVFPGNDRSVAGSHQGLVMVFDPETGTPAALVDAGAITAVRTAAVTGVATRALACDGPAVVALLGSGEQAATHLEAMRLARPVDRVRVWSPTPENAARFAAEFGVEAAATAEEAVRGATIVCAVTSAREPVLRGEWLAPGMHVNAVGSSTRFARELDSASVAMSRVFVDRMESALAEAGDLLVPIEEGAIGAGHIVGELGAVLDGRIAGRRSAAEITLFKSLGLAVEDVAAACYVTERAIEAGRGLCVDM